MGNFSSASGANVGFVLGGMFSVISISLCLPLAFLAPYIMVSSVSGSALCFSTSMIHKINNNIGTNKDGIDNINLILKYYSIISIILGLNYKINDTIVNSKINKQIQKEIDNKINNKINKSLTQNNKTAMESFISIISKFIPILTILENETHTDIKNIITKFMKNNKKINQNNIKQLHTIINEFEQCIDDNKEPSCELINKLKQIYNI
jgi:hypothetical protein